MSNNSKTTQNVLLKNLKRGKKITSAGHSFFGGVYKAYKIDAFKEPPRDILPKYIQIFCQKMGESFGVKVIQVEPVPKKHALWVSNHISWLDVAVVGGVSQVFFIAKAEIEKWPLAGGLAKAGGTLFIKRGSGDSGSIGQQIARFLKQGSSVVFFPEATTTNGHKIKKLHGKLLQAAMETGLPIQPIVICYVNKDGSISDELAYCDISMKQSLKQVLDAKDVTAYVLPLEAIFPEGRNQDELTDILHHVMQAGLTKLQKQVLSVKPSDALWD